AQARSVSEVGGAASRFTPIAGLQVHAKAALGPTALLLSSGLQLPQGEGTSSGARPAGQTTSPLSTQQQPLSQPAAAGSAGHNVTPLPSSLDAGDQLGQATPPHHPLPQPSPLPSQPQPGTPTEVLVAMHCYHGFGANLFSWAAVQPLLAASLGGIVSAHDAPGFGLTQRPADVSSYYLDFNGSLGALVMEAELAAVLATRPAASSSTAGQPQGDDKLQSGVHEVIKATGAAGAAGRKEEDADSALGKGQGQGQGPQWEEQALDGGQAGQPWTVTRTPHQAAADDWLSSSPASSLTDPSLYSSRSGSSRSSSSSSSSSTGGVEGGVVSADRHQAATDPALRDPAAAAEAVESVTRTAGEVVQAALSAASGPAVALGSTLGGRVAMSQQVGGSAGGEGDGEAEVAAAAQQAAGVVAEQLSSARGVPVFRVLVGHSLGGICAALQALAAAKAGSSRGSGAGAGRGGGQGAREETEGSRSQVDAVVLVAPAILVMGKGGGAPPGLEVMAVEVEDSPFAGLEAGEAQEAGLTRFRTHTSLEARPAGSQHRPHLSKPTSASTSSDSSGGSSSARPDPCSSSSSSSSRPPVTSTSGGWPGGAVASSTALPHPAPPAGLALRVLRLARVMTQSGLLVAVLGLLHLLRPLIVLLLRVAVRSRTFWIKGLQQAYHDPAKVTDQVVDAYRLPQLVRGWEAGMFNFLVARLAHVASLGPLKQQLAAVVAGREVVQDPQDMDLALSGLRRHRTCRLSELCAERKLPCLILHGKADRLVPAWNSVRLAGLLPGCELALLERCGHMPQEEWPRLFTALVTDFVRRRVLEPTRGQDMSRH
ncbi:hypothetical protein QJQ45_021459, partial [Haematococcus lacustris]